MKKAVSLVLALVLVSSSVLPVAAQKRQLTGGKKQKGAGAIVESTSFDTFGAYSDGGGVWLSWRMKAEIGNIGFYVYRVGKDGAEMLSPAKFVQGAATFGREIPSYGETYGFFDRDGDGTSAYYVEAFGLNGEKIRTAQIYPQYVPSLESWTGLSSADLANRGELAPANLENSILTYTKEIANEIAENSAVPDPVTHQAVISTPGAVRIGVKAEGLYRVSRANLGAAGFDVNSDSSLWQLYVEGIEQAIIVGPNADYIEFYGKGTDTPETDIRKYFLIVGSTAGKRIEQRVATRNTSTVVTPSYLQTYVKKERTQYVEDIINDDAENYFGRAINSVGTTMPFTITGVDFGSPTVTLRLRFQGYSSTLHTVEVTLNNQLIGNASGPAGEQSFDATFFIPTSQLLEGANSIKFRSTAVASDFNFFDTMSIDFSRKYLAEQNKLKFYTQNYRAARLDGFTTPNVRVFDMTNESTPVLMTNLEFQQMGSTYGVDMPASRGRAFYAIEDSALLAPESVTTNNPELIGVPTNEADLVIISYKDFLAEAQTWANYRAAQGVSVKVIEVTEIFDEFNYGSLSSNSIKSFLNYARLNWQNPPEYVMLMGDGSWDSRNYEGIGFFNYVPPRMVSTVFTDTASDEALADFDGDGLAEMAIGRISVRTPAQATTVFNKVVAWEAQAGNPMDRGALFAYDHNNGYPFDQMSTNLRNKIPGMSATMVYRGEPSAATNLIAAMNTGKFIVNYSGHGSAGSWNADFFTVFTVTNPAMMDHDPSIYTMLTCLNGFFHWLYNPSLAEVLTNTPNRGAVASWASSGKTTPDIQEVMALRFYEKVNEGTILRMGDLVRDAKSSLVFYGADVRLSWVLIGDPMLKVRNAPPAPIAK